MFFDATLMRSEEISTVWKAAHQMEVEVRHGDDRNSLPGICSTVKRWISSEHGDPRLRMSLRSGAELVAGSARLCLKRLNDLVEGSENSEKMPVTPEEMMGRGSSKNYITYRKIRNNSFQMSPLMLGSPNVSPLEQSNIENLTSPSSQELVPFPSHQTSANSGNFDIATSLTQESPSSTLDQLAYLQNASRERSVTENSSSMADLPEDQRRSKTFIIEKNTLRNSEYLSKSNTALGTLSKSSDDQQNPDESSPKSSSLDIKEKSTPIDSLNTIDSRSDSDNISNKSSSPLIKHSKNSDNLQNPDQTSEEKSSDQSNKEKDTQTHSIITIDLRDDSNNMSENSNLNRHNKNPDGTQNPDLTSRDKPNPSTKQEGTQTEQFNTKKTPLDGQFYADSPYGVILVHDNFHSRFPSKVICTSLTADVLMKFD